MIPTRMLDRTEPFRAEKKQPPKYVDASLSALETEKQCSVVYRLPRETINSQERTADYVEARRLNFTPKLTASQNHHDQDIPVCDTEPANEHVDNHIVSSAPHPAQNQLNLHVSY